MSSRSSEPSGVATWAYGLPAPEYRLPADTRVGPVRLQVADLDRSLAYYGPVLGMRTLEQGSGVAVLGAAGPARPLIELRERVGAAPVSGRGRLGLYHFALLLPDRALLGAFAGHLSEIGEQAGASDHLVSEALYLRDPDGLGIEVYADRPRGEWRHEGGQLVMATHPLDLASVVRVAGGAGWSGMPEGTTMGHVHLHVGDLRRAAAFYHDALGLDKTVWSYPGALFLSAGGYHHHLGLNTWATDAPVPGPDDARLLAWTLVLPDTGAVERAAASLASAGHTVARDAGRIVARDPWTTALQLVSAESADRLP